MKLTELELKEQIHNTLRWEKFVDQQATEEKLKALFNQMPEAFDGTTVRARHILIEAGNDPKAKQDATTKLLAIKDQIQKTVAAGMAKLPADADSCREAKAEVVFDRRGLRRRRAGRTPHVRRRPKGEICAGSRAMAI